MAPNAPAGEQDDQTAPVEVKWSGTGNQRNVDAAKNAQKQHALLPGAGQKREQDEQHSQPRAVPLPLALFPGTKGQHDTDRRNENADGTQRIAGPYTPKGDQGPIQTND